MSAFREVREKQARVPTHHVILAPDDFADDWPERPAAEVAFGCRLLADGDAQTARAEAMKLALELHDDYVGQVEAFNDALMRWAIVRSLTDPNDLAILTPMFASDEGNVRLALTSRGIRHAWDQIERHHVERSPLVREATDEELTELAAHIATAHVAEGGVEANLFGPEGKMSAGARKRFRKFAAFLLAEIRDARGADEDDEDDDEIEVVIDDV